MTLALMIGGIVLALAGVGVLLRVALRARTVLRGTADDADAALRRMGVENALALGLAATGLALIAVAGLA
ncbi:MAG: hypothetical protein ACFBWO_11225 [Paracoccaceae bacterium]